MENDALQKFRYDLIYIEVSWALKSLRLCMMARFSS